MKIPKLILTINLFILLFYPSYAANTAQDYANNIDRAYAYGQPMVMERNWKKLCELEPVACQSVQEQYNAMLYEARIKSQQKWQNTLNNFNQVVQQYNDDRMRQYEIDMKYAPRYQPTIQTHNINLNHNIRYNDF